jgi:hypothetical protein
MKRMIQLWLVTSTAVGVTKAAAQDCYESSIVSPSPFMGNNEEIFRLDDGTLWEVKYEYEYLYEYYPSVIICPSEGRLIIDEKSLNVEPISHIPATPELRRNEPSSVGTWELFEETSLRGSVRGRVRKGRIFKTMSGNIYEVTGVTLQLVMELQPEVIVLRSGNVFKLIIEGFDEPLICRKLN